MLCNACRANEKEGIKKIMSDTTATRNIIARLANARRRGTTWTVNPNPFNIVNPIYSPSDFDDDIYNQELTKIQQYMFDTYRNNWNELADKSIRIYNSNGSYGNNANIVRVNPRLSNPILTDFLTIDVDDNERWLKIWQFEITDIPEEIKAQNKIAEVEKLKTLEERLEELKTHKLIEKAYLSLGANLVVITKPTFAIDRNTGQETKMPMGRWMFIIGTSNRASLYGTYVYNLDYAVFHGNGTNFAFHHFSCWGGHEEELANIFRTKDYLSLVDFLINFKCLFPHDDRQGMGNWGILRRKIKKEDTAIATYLQSATPDPKTWIIGDKTSDKGKILDLYRDDIPELDSSFSEGYGKSLRSYIDLLPDEEPVIGTIVRLKPKSEYYSQAPDQVGIARGRDMTISGLMIRVLFESGMDRYYWPKDLVKLRTQKKLIQELKTAGGDN